MTGIERLRQMAEDFKNVKTAEHCTFIVNTWRGRYIDDAIADIADQIEREQGGRVSRMRVLSVVTEMERHVSGAEGMGDSPVARWARGLREALGGDGHDPAADVSVSAYDLLPQEDREAIAWVREHGGMDYVKSEWRSRVPYDRYERRRQRLRGHIAECETALGRRNARIKELGCRVNDLMIENAELRRRAMPEGMEWLIEAWPRFEDGEPVRFLDDFERYGEENGVSAVTMYRDGSYALNFMAYSKDERVRRPAPKVYDADGAEIREGDRVWSTHLDEPHEWIVIDPHEDSGDSQTVLVSIGDRTGHARPENLTHRAPVLAADGVPLEVGQTVWHVATGRKYTVRSCTNGGAHLSRDGKPAGYCRAEYLTHQRPVLDADGVPIKKGDTVYLLPGEWCDEWPCCGFHGGEELEVFADGEASHVPGSVQCREKEKRFGFHGTCYPKPSQLTHTKPEIDTWQRIEEDSTLSPEVYCHRNGIDISQKDGTEIFLADTVEPMARDLVRRCRALAERERGE